MGHLKVGGATTRSVRLVVRSHGIFDAGMGVVGVVHSNVSVAVARRGTHGHWGSGGRIGIARSRKVDGMTMTIGVRVGVDVDLRESGAVILAMVRTVGRVGRRRLTGIVSGHLSAAVVSSRGTGRVGILLPRRIHVGQKGGNAGQRRGQRRVRRRESTRNGESESEGAATLNLDDSSSRDGGEVRAGPPFNATDVDGESQGAERRQRGAGCNRNGRRRCELAKLPSSKRDGQMMIVVQNGLASGGAQCWSLGRTVCRLVWSGLNWSQLVWRYCQYVKYVVPTSWPAGMSGPVNYLCTN